MTNSCRNWQAWSHPTSKQQSLNAIKQVIVSAVGFSQPLGVPQVWEVWRDLLGFPNPCFGIISQLSTKDAVTDWHVQTWVATAAGILMYFLVQCPQSLQRLRTGGFDIRAWRKGQTAWKRTCMSGRCHCISKPTGSRTTAKGHLGLRLWVRESYCQVHG